MTSNERKEEESNVVVLDFLESKHVDAFVKRDLAYWNEQKSVVEYFTTHEVPLLEEVDGLSSEVVQSAFEYVQRALTEYNTNNFNSERWGEVLESYALWEHVSQRVRKYCETMANLGVEVPFVAREQKKSLDDEPIPRELSKDNPFLVPELGDQEDEYCTCDCCGNETVRCLFSCALCGSPLHSLVGVKSSL